MKLTQEQIQALERFDAKRPVAMPARRAPELSPEQVRARERYTMGFLPDEYAIPADSFLGDLARGAKKRVLGLAQLGAEALGADETVAIAEELATQYRKEGEGTGVRGFVGEILGDPLTAALAPIAPAATSVKALAGVGALGGALEGLTSEKAAGESRAMDTAFGAAAGMVLGPVLGKAAQGLGYFGDKSVNVVKTAGRKATPYVKQSVQRVRGFIDDIANGADDEIAIAVRGIDTEKKLNKAIQTLSDDAKQSFKRAKRAGLTKEQAYLDTIAQRRGVKMTGGQLKQDPQLQRFEDQARNKVYGDDVYQIALESEQANKIAMRNWADELLADVTDNPNAIVDETTTGGKIRDALVPAYNSLKKASDDAYAIGKLTRAEVATENTRHFNKTLKAALDRDDVFLADVTPAFKNDVKALTKLLGGVGDDVSKVKTVKWKALNNIRRRLNNKASWDTSLPMVADDAQKQSIRGYRTLSREYNDLLDDLITQKVLLNPDDAAKELAKAPALYRDFRKAFEKGSAVEKIVTQDMTDKQIVDLLGSGVTGKGASVSFINELRGALGDQAEPIMGQLRGRMLNKITKGAYTTDGEFISTAAKRERDKILTNNKEFYDALFNSEQQQAVDEFIKVAYQMSNKVRSATNPSGSSIGNISFFNNLLRRMGVAGDAVAGLVEGLGQGAQERAKQNIAIRSFLEPLKDMPADSRIVRDAVRNIAARPSIQPLSELPADVIAPPTTQRAAPQQGGTPDVKLPSGSLTPEQIRALENMPQEQSQAPQISEDFYMRVAAAESGGNPNAKAKTSSAKGLFQFTQPTWKNMVKKYGDMTGIEKDDIMNPQAQKTMMKLLTEENRIGLMNKLERMPTEGELYVAHFFGLSDAAKMLNKRGSGEKAARVTPKAAKANRSIFFDDGRARSVDEVLAILERKVA